MPSRGPTAEGCPGWSLGESRADHVGRLSTPRPLALAPSTARPLLPGRVFLLVPAHPSCVLPVPPSLPVLLGLSLPAQPAFPGPATLSLCPWCCSSLAGAHGHLLGLYTLAGYIPFICTKEEGSCVLWEMGEERRGQQGESSQFYPVPNLEAASQTSAMTNLDGRLCLEVGAMLSNILQQLFNVLLPSY